jgi:thiamine pyrophosphokinase
VSPAWHGLDPGAESVILAGPVLKGPLAPPSLNVLGLADTPQIAVDGGIRFAHNPILWAGDGDSGVAPRHIPAIVKAAQDETDLRFCLNGIRSWRWRDLHLFGFIGARPDHALANFGEIHAEMKQRSRFQKGVFYDENLRPLVVFFAAGEHVFTHEGIFSLLVFERSAVTLSGKCRYPAEGLVIEALSGAGVSNEASGDVRLASGSPVAIVFPDE